MPPLRRCSGCRSGSSPIGPARPCPARRARWRPPLPPRCRPGSSTRSPAPDSRPTPLRPGPSGRANSTPRRRPAMTARRRNWTVDCRPQDSTTAAVTARAAAAEQQGAEVSVGAEGVRQEGARAAASVASLTPAAADLVSPPATAVVAPGVVAQQDQRISAVAAEVGRSIRPPDRRRPGSRPRGPVRRPLRPRPPQPPPRPGLPGRRPFPQVASIVGNSIGPAATPSWNCDLASVISTAGGLQQNAVTTALSLAEQGMGSDRFGQVSRFARSMGQGIDRVVGAVRTKLDAASAAARAGLADLGRTVTAPATAAVAAVRRGFDAVTSSASSASRGPATQCVEETVRDRPGREQGSVRHRHRRPPNPHIRGRNRKSTCSAASAPRSSRCCPAGRAPSPKACRRGSPRQRLRWRRPGPG